MINISEIRVGNILLMQITDSWQARPIKVNEFLALSEHPEWAKPLHISEEILLKCGFDPRKINNIRDDYQDRLLEFEFIENSLDLWISDEKEDQATYFRLDNIKHLHQLQNLYFALCGQELNTSGL